MGIVAAYVVPHPPLIVPSVGKGEERAIQSTINSYNQVARRIAEYKPDTIVISSPHAPLYRDCFFISMGDIARGDMSRFGVLDSEISAKLDSQLSLDVVSRSKQYGIPVVSDPGFATSIDHATYVPLYFINQVYTNYKLVRVGLSALSFDAHKQFGRCISSSIDNLYRRCVFIASGDLSHKLKADGPYGFAKEGPEFDEQIIHVFQTGELENLFDFDEHFCREAAECGLRSFLIMTGILEGTPHSAKCLSYEGPFGVGYAVAAFERPDA